MADKFDSSCYPIHDVHLASLLWILEGRMAWAQLSARVLPLLSVGAFERFAMETTTTPRWYAARGTNAQYLLFGGARNFPLSYGVYRGYNRTEADSTTDAANTFIGQATATLAPIVADAIDVQSGPPLTIAGYSMGGAMAHLYHLGLKRAGATIEISSRSFGAPPPTLGSVRQFLTDEDVTGYIAEDDPIPWLPGDQVKAAGPSLFGTEGVQEAPYNERFIQVYPTAFLGNDLSQVFENVPPISNRPEPFNWTLTGWATGLMQTPSKAHAISNYFQLLWEGSIPHRGEGQNIAVPPAPEGGVNIMQQLPGMEPRDDIVLPRDIVRRALESYNPLTAVRFRGSARQRTRCNRQVPFSLCRGPGGYFVSHYGTPLFPAKGRREGRRLASALNRIVQRAWETPHVDVDGLLNRLGYELGSV